MVTEFEFFPIKDYRDTYLSAIPIDTPYGKVRFLTMRESVEYAKEMAIMSMNVLHFYWAYRRQFEKLGLLNDENRDEFEQLREATLYEIISDVDGHAVRNEHYYYYQTIFNLVLNDVEMVNQIMSDENMFMDMRNIVCDMNSIKEEKVFKTERLQRDLEDKRKMERRDLDEKFNLTDMISSVAVQTGWTYDHIYNSTYFQIQMTFMRMSQLINHEVTTLFATVPTEKPTTIEPWNKHIDIFESKEEIGMTKSKFDSIFGGIMK